MNLNRQDGVLSVLAHSEYQNPDSNTQCTDPIKYLCIYLKDEKFVIKTTEGSVDNISTHFHNENYIH